jgi:ankyrin repeat protein
MLAAKRRDGLDLVKCLVEHGADVAVRNAKGLTAADLTRWGDIKEYLTLTENQ